MSRLTTYTGLHVDPLSPRPEDLEIKDIAHALSLQCRGNGQVTQFFSVAQHCINCANEAKARGYSDRVVLACLIHDAAESFMSDVPRPLKQLLPQYIEMEEQFIDLIYTKFLGSSLTSGEAALVKKVDDDNLYFDLILLLKEHPGKNRPDMKSEPDYRLRSFEEVEAQFLAMFEELSTLVKG